MSKSNDTPCPNLDEFVELYQYVNVTPDTENLPVETNLDFGSAINIGLSSGVMIQILYSRYGDIFVRGYAYWEIPKWKPWVPIVTATPPQEYDLPLAEGMSAVNPCTYRKNQFSEVSVGGSASGTIEVGTAIATLPSGFRPQKTVERPAVYASANGAWTGGSVAITTDGIVRAYGQISATSVAFAVDFVAADY